MSDSLTRRTWLQTGVAALASPWMTASARETGVLGFRLIETAGLHRTAESVSTVVPWPEPSTRLGLFCDGRPVGCQFRPWEALGHPPLRRLDFLATMGPNQVQRYEVRPQNGEPRPAPGSDLSLETTPDSYRVARDGVETFEVSRNLHGLFRSIGPARLPYHDGESPGLFLQGADDARTSAVPEGASPRVTVDREGPFAIGLRFAWSHASGAESNLSLTFPVSHSLVGVRWTISGSAPTLRAIGLELRLRLDRPSSEIEGNSGPRPRWATLEDRERRVQAVALPGLEGLNPELTLTDDGRVRVSHRLRTGTDVPSMLACWFGFEPTTTPPRDRISVRALREPLRVLWDENRAGSL